MNEPTARILLAGLPSTGKTTFLAALWHVLDSGELVSSLRLLEQPKERTYLNEIRSAWSKGEPVTRTGSGQHHSIELALEIVGGDRFTLSAPDLSGEAYRDLWTKRMWLEHLHELAVVADGVLLFVHPDAITPVARIDQADELLGALNSGSPPEPHYDPMTKTGFDAERTCTATQLVFILQALRDRATPKQVPTGVIISAWDIITPKDEAPDAWFKRQVPLAHQFLHSTSTEYPFRTFGVSALGGDISNAQERDSLLCKSKPSERISVVTSEGITPDISRPVKWLVSSRP